jgi:hypothetical protein
MKSGLKSISAAALLVGMVATGNAQANAECSLSISSNSVAVGQSFSFNVSINEVLPSPLPPPNHPMYQVYFYGVNERQNPYSYTWIGPEAVANDLPMGGGTLSGYYNPGGIYGVYTRYAAVYSGPRFVCVTNWVWTILQ